MRIQAGSSRMVDLAAVCWLSVLRGRYATNHPNDVFGGMTVAVGAPLSAGVAEGATDLGGDISASGRGQGFQPSCTSSVPMVSSRGVTRTTPWKQAFFWVGTVAPHLRPSTSRYFKTCTSTANLPLNSLPCLPNSDHRSRSIHDRSNASR